MHPKAQDLIRDLPDQFDVRTEPDGKLAVSYHRHCLASYEPDREHVVIRVAVLVETVDGESRVHVDLNELTQALHNLAWEGLHVVDHHIKPVGGGEDKGKNFHLLRLEGEGIAPGFLLAVIIGAWEWSLPAIERGHGEHIVGSLA